MATAAEDENPAKIAARTTPLDVLGAEIEALWAELDHFKQLDAICGGFSYERMRISSLVASKAVVREGRLAEERKEREIAPADVEVSQDLNERGHMQDCVFATCERSGVNARSWGTSSKSVFRTLLVLTEQCDCGARKHVEEKTA